MNCIDSNQHFAASYSQRLNSLFMEDDVSRSNMNKSLSHSIDSYSNYSIAPSLELFTHPKATTPYLSYARIIFLSWKVARATFHSNRKSHNDGSWNSSNCFLSQFLYRRLQTFSWRKLSSMNKQIMYNTWTTMLLSHDEYGLGLQY